MHLDAKNMLGRNYCVNWNTSSSSLHNTQQEQPLLLQQKVNGSLAKLLSYYYANCSRPVETAILSEKKA
jgi:hypothetical protein